MVHTGSRWYLAWDRARQDWRTFRIDCIQRPAILGDHFDPRPGPEDGGLKAFVSRSMAFSPFPTPRRASCCTRRGK